MKEGEEVSSEPTLQNMYATVCMQRFTGARLTERRNAINSRSNTPHLS